MNVEIKTQTENENVVEAPELSDVAFFSIVNKHSEEMQKKHRLAHYEYLKEKERMQKNVSKEKKGVSTYIGYFIVFICVLFLCWIFLSWVNVVQSTRTPETIKFMWDWNFFKVFFP